MNSTPDNRFQRIAKSLLSTVTVIDEMGYNDGNLFRCYSRKGYSTSRNLPVVLIYSDKENTKFDIYEFITMAELGRMGLAQAEQIGAITKDDLENKPTPLIAVDMLTKMKDKMVDENSYSTIKSFVNYNVRIGDTPEQAVAKVFSRYIAWQVNPLKDLNGFFKFVVKKHSTGGKDLLYHILCIKQKLHPSVFEGYFGKVEFTEESTVKTDHIDKWNLIVAPTVKFERDVLVKFLSNVEALLSKEHLQSLAYGDLVITTTLKQGHLAEYEMRKDNILLKVKGLNPDERASRSLIHELGHRKFDRYFNIQQKKAVFEKYNELKKKIPALQIDDIIDMSVGVVKILDRALSRGNMIYKALVIEPKENKFPKDTVLKLTGIQSYKILNKPQPENAFPTSYSGVSPTEFFAEMFAEWLTGKLSPNLSEWMKDLMTDKVAPVKDSLQ